MKNVNNSSLKLLKVIVKAIIFIILVSIDSNRTLLAQDPGNYTVINGAKLWYETSGKGEPLLLIPGGPGFSHVYFTPHFAKLSDKFNIIYYDAFGQGKVRSC